MLEALRWGYMELVADTVAMYEAHMADVPLRAAVDAPPYIPPLQQPSP